jgi:DNA primase
VTRLAHRRGLRQETVWASLGELRAGRRTAELAASRPARTDPEPVEPAGGPAVRAERQLLELLLAEPILVSTAAAHIAPDLIQHTGLRRMLAEMYALQESGQTPDLDALRVRLIDRPDLVEAAQRLQFVGRHTQDRPDYLRRVLNWFEGQRLEAEKQAIKDQLAAGADDEQARELLRQVMARSAAPAGRP